MVGALDTLKAGFIDIERMYIHQIKEHKNKGDNIAKKFKEVAKSQSDNHTNVVYKIDVIKNNLFKAMDGVKKSTGEMVTHAQTRMDKIMVDFEEDKAANKKQFAKFWERDKIKEWVEKLVEKTETKLQNQLDRHKKEYRERIAFIINDNLTIPGVVGPSQCKFTNLSDYLQARDRETRQEIQQV